MNIAEYDMKFIPEMKYLCAKNCAYQVLDYLGIENPLDYIYIGFTPYICAFQNDFFPSGKVLSISDKTSIVSSGSGINFAEVFDLNLSQRNYGLYPIVLVDTYYLPYRQEYMKHHGAHAIIFNGVKGEDVDIVDWYDPAFFKGTIKFQCYADARDSSFSDSSNPFTLRAVKNRWFCIEPDKITTHNRKLIINENLSVRKTEEIVKNIVEDKKIKNKLKEKDIFIKDIEERLMNTLGTKVNISSGKKKGKIEIEYYTDEDLNDIIDRLLEE